MFKVTDLNGFLVYDSRGIPTTAAKIQLNGSFTGIFMCPSGASKGKREALELRDDDSKNFFNKGVSKALKNINETIKKNIAGKSFTSIEDFDRALLSLDSTEQKSVLGANAILPVSASFMKAQAKATNNSLWQAITPDLKKSLPTPLINVINGGAHANNSLCIQEFMIVPHAFNDFKTKMKVSAEIFHKLKEIIHKKGFSTAVGDEGGFAPPLEASHQALDILSEAVVGAGYTLQKDISFALDVAANELFDEKNKIYLIDDQKLSSEKLLDYYMNLVKNYPIVSIEDPFFEEDLNGFESMMTSVSNSIQVVGDDLFVTNKNFISKNIQKKYANALLVKMNQVGTISETIAAVLTAKKLDMNIIVSHRSGETEDTTIADLAVALGADYIKTGSLSRSDRIAKYNRLLIIEDEFKNF